MKATNRAKAILLSLLFLVTSSMSPAGANLSAKAFNISATSLKTGIFAVAPETTTTGTATAIISLTSTTTNNVDYSEYYVNTGNINVATFTYTVTHTVGTGAYVLDACPVGKTYTSPTVCSDASTPIVIPLTGTGPALTPGQWYPIHLHINRKNDVFTVASSVSQSQIRAAVNTVS